MHTRSSANVIVEPVTVPKRRNRRRSKQIVKPELRTIVDTPVATMADTRTMSELLQAPTEGYGDAIVLLPILADNFERKVGLLQLVTSSQFHGFERDDPHAHIRGFNKITSTLKYQNISNETIKLMLFLFSLDGAAWIWLEKEPPRSILTWKDLVSKFVNHFFPPSKTTNLKNDITNFQQIFDESFGEAWNRFKDLLLYVPILKPEVVSKPNPKTSIPYTSRLNNQKLQEKMNNQMLKFLQIFGRLHFDLSFADALLHMLKFASTFKSLLKLTLRVNDEAIMFKVRHTSRYSRNYYEESVNQINVIDVACEEYALEVLGFSDSSTSGNPNLSDLTIATSSPSFTPFEGSDIILEEIETFLRTLNELSNLDDDYYDAGGDILYLEKLLNEDPSLNLPPMKNEDVKQVDVTMTKPSIEEPPKLELKDLPPHLEYAFLEGTDKLPVIISKELKDKEKAALLKGYFHIPIDPQDQEKTTGSDIILEEIETFLRTLNELSNLDDDYYDAGGDILYLEKLLNEDPSLNLPPMKNEDVKQVDVTMTKPSIEEPPKLELKDLPPHLEYAFLEGTDKLPVIISKELKDKEKAALLKGYFHIPIDPQDQEKTTGNEYDKKETKSKQN
uniref:Reverse transcriptase domain-containing protein n=1 Tax=Tanacetum cinerariifolium TaxID=118510 RepID=A0A699H9M7_TANCI|nr:reverse transcriptase domain-containing protein [Tanacetum cinerariifolium]